MITIEIQNNGTGTEEFSNYDFRVLINSKVVRIGEIRGHDREHGFEELFQLLTNEVTAKCEDCGMLYDNFGIDSILPHSQWEKICPENKILCSNCIVKRAAFLDDVICIGMLILTKEEYKQFDMKK